MEVKKQSQARPAKYPTSSDLNLKTFQINYNHELSLETRLLLNSFPKKYIYYAIDDILYALNLSLNERENLLSILYSVILSLHNTKCINFFDIWIHDLYITKDLKTNRFLRKKFHNSYHIIVTVLYKTKKLTPKPEPLW